MSAPETAPPDAFRQAAMDLIQSASTLTLSTADPAGPWSAPVYFVFLKGCFYFFSSAQSRHIRQALNTGRAAASLYYRDEGWESIRGVQMTGVVDRVQSARVSVKAIGRYLKRFPFVGQFFPGNPAPDMAAFFSRFDARLYAFVPEEVFYTDNRFGFGARRRIHWNP
jgi:uncharacterized protein YhbP (UPF0306 family)